MPIPASLTFAAAAVVIAAITAQPARSEGASDQLIDASNPQKLVSIIRDMGYRAELETDAVGDPMIRSSVGGTRFAIVFYGCDQTRHDDCEFLLYKVGYDMVDGVELDVINQWNATQLVGRAYRDDVDDPWLETSWNLEGGVSVHNFRSSFEWWEAAVGKFERHIGF